MRVLEQLSAIDLSLASLVFIHNANGIRPIVGYATPAMRDELLPLLAKGRELSAFALTEPVAGSNLPGIATVAVPGRRWGLADTRGQAVERLGLGGRRQRLRPHGRPERPARACDGVCRPPGHARPSGRAGIPHHGGPEHYAE